MSYRTDQKQNSHYKQMINAVDTAAKPIFIIKPETTGFDPEKDRICGILAMRCYFLDHQISLDGKYQAVIKTEVPVSEQMAKINGFSQELIDKKGISTKQMLTELKEFLEDKPTICGFGTKDFIAPFLYNTMEREGIRININAAFDIRTMAKAVLPPQKSMECNGYSARDLAKRCGTEYTPEGIVNIFNTIYERIPMGAEGVDDNFIKGADYWSKGYNSSFVYFRTKCGKVALNLRTLYFEECMPGYFDVVSMDKFTDYLIKKTNSNNLKEVAEKLEKRAKQK